MIARVPAGALVVAGEDLDLLRYAVERAQWARARNGLSPSQRLDSLAALIETVAANGHTDIATEPADEAGTSAWLMDMPEVARLLGCSIRHARRLAPKLGGRKIAGRWLADRLAVAEHIGGTP